MPPPPIHRPRVESLPSGPLPPPDIFLSSSRARLCTFNKPCETRNASTSAHSPLHVRVFPSSATASFLPPGPSLRTRLTHPCSTSSASSCAPTSLAHPQAPHPPRTRKEGLLQRPARDEQRFLLRLEHILSLRRIHPQRGQRPQIQRHRQRTPHFPSPYRA
ncbi:hypothetical protein C8R44DRAFT_896122 [Mycena epipterygia]|nr:hypothetical protein C8R44DRAFT_896122 [Mycena epipterygia]